MNADQLMSLPFTERLSADASAARTALLGQAATINGAAFTADQLNAMSAESLAALPAGAFALVPPTVIQALLPATVAAMTPAQVAALRNPEMLSTAAVAVLSADQVSGIRAGWNAVGAAWLNALSPDAVAALPGQAMALLSVTAVKGLSGTTVSALSAAQCRAMTNITSIPTGSLTANAIQAMTPAQIACIGNFDWLPAAAIAALSPAQVPAIATGMSWMSAAWLNALTPEAFAALSAAQMKLVSKSAAQGLDAAHVAALSPAQLAVFTNLGSLSAAGMAGMSVEQVASLSLQQIASLTHAEGFSAGVVASLSADQVRAVNAAVWGQVGPAWINQLSADAFQAIPISTFSHLAAPALRGLSADAVGRMSAEQVAALTNVGWISEAAASAIRPEQLSRVTDFDTVSARWLNALSVEAFAAIPADGVNQMSLAALQGLDATRRGIAMGKADKTHAGYLAAASRDAGISYDSVLAMLTGMQSGIGADGLSVDQFAAINGMLSGAKAVNGGQTYVSSLLTSMIGKDGLAAGMSADAFTASVNKWFLGTNNPKAASYVDLSDSVLFKGATGQAALSVAQGGYGNCWLISSVEELAAVAPDRLSGLISANGNGTFAVKFYSGGADNPFFITVDGVASSKGASVAGGSWVRLLEDAYVEAMASGYFVANGHAQIENDYSIGMGGNYGRIAQRSLTGGVNKIYGSGIDAREAVVAALEDGSGLVTHGSWRSATDENGKTTLVGGHAFSIIGVNETNGKYIFRNPWSSSMVFEMSAQELDALPGSCNFSVTEMGDEYGSQALRDMTAAGATAMAQALTDTAALVQAMAGFAQASGAMTTASPEDRPQTAAPLLATSR